MIENIRKYTGLIIFFMALVVFSLVIGIKDDLFRGSAGGGHGILKIDGRVYSDKEFQNLGSGAFQVASGLARSGDFGLYQFIMSLSTGATSQDDAAEKFFVGRMILRQAKEEFGVHPGEEEISEYLRKLRAFSSPEGKFDQESYRRFVEKGIGHLGMTETDLRELASDALAAQKINAIVGSGLGVNRDIVAQNLALDNQRVAGSLARLDIDSYEAAIQPTEEEIKAYWETIQDAFTTAPLRKFTYIIATPDMPADAEAEKEDAPSIADAALSDEAKKAADKKKADEKAKKTAELAETRRKKQIEIDAKVDEFTFQLEEQKGAGFEELAKTNGWEAKATELFAQATPPAELDIKLRSSSRGGKAVDELFRIEPTSDPVSKISQPIAIGENQWLVARLDGEEKSRPKTYEEAKDEARAQYIAEKAAEALKTAANEAVAKIKDALAAGKSFADAAKDAGLKETRDFTKVTSDYRPDAATEPRNLFEATRNVDPGSLAEVITEADRAFIVHVAKREVEKTPDAATKLDAEVANRARQNETIAFMSWIAARVEASKVEQLYKQR
ncbi:MAG: SurA N-terminal domain-containing protein [Luteolibacter sp.]|jgi:DNA-binding phage protein|nr:SurA N-terminal domain-containing protein [Luteolibacter sp.]